MVLCKGCGKEFEPEDDETVCEECPSNSLDFGDGSSLCDDAVDDQRSDHEHSLEGLRVIRQLRYESFACDRADEELHELYD